MLRFFKTKTAIFNSCRGLPKKVFNNEDSILVAKYKMVSSNGHIRKRNMDDFSRQMLSIDRVQV